MLTQVVRPQGQGCEHCGNPVNNEERFCCAGCETVHAWISANHLDKYYDLKAKSAQIRRPVSASGPSEDFRAFDDPEFQRAYARVTPQGRWMDFYLEGAHCAACVWLTEKLSSLVEDVEFARLNLGNSVATVRLGPKGSFASVAEELRKMGYRAHPVRLGENAAHEKRENRLFLARLGVAAASAGNIMLLAVSLYAGVSGKMGEHFRWISFALFVPVLVFSAVPFYRSAWTAIKFRQVSIDVPVVFGILLGSFASIINLFLGNDRVYFDSISMLVLLLLSTRYLIKRTQQRALESSRLIHFVTPSRARRWDPGAECFREVGLELVRPGDRVQVLPGESVPVDGKVVSGDTYIDSSLLTGESHPERKKRGSQVFAGTRNLDSPFQLEVTLSGSATRVGRIVDSMERVLAERPRITLFADRVSRYFVGAVVILAGVIVVAGPSGTWQDGLNRALALAIVTCPCTFALITPLAFSRSLGRLARAGILVKSPEALERLASIRKVFLDKTGTLTYGNPKVSFWGVPAAYSAALEAIESGSSHPVARAIVSYLKRQPSGREALPVVVKEKAGYGIEGEVDGARYSLVRSSERDSGFAGTEVSVRRNNAEIGLIRLNDETRSDSAATVTELKRMGIDPWVVSGDHACPVAQAATNSGISLTHVKSEVGPEGKALLVEQYGPVAMVGDGANDALAMAKAAVGISVRGGVEISLRAADIYVAIPGLRPIASLFVVGRETLRVVKRNLALSVVYNVIAGALAVMGKIDPLVAAVLMPASAATVFLSSVIGTRALRAAFRELEQ